MARRRSTLKLFANFSNMVKSEYIEFIIGLKLMDFDAEVRDKTFVRIISVYALTK